MFAKMIDRPLNEPALVARLRNGDEQAFSELYFRYAAELIRYAGARLFRLEDARDIVQDVFIKLWKEKENLKDTESIAPYLYTLTRHQVIDHIRKNAVRQEYGLLLQQLRETTTNALEQLA